jgi:hypothetical protein
VRVLALVARTAVLPGPGCSSYQCHGGVPLQVGKLGDAGRQRRQEPGRLISIRRERVGRQCLIYPVFDQ